MTKEELFKMLLVEKDKRIEELKEHLIDLRVAFERLYNVVLLSVSKVKEKKEIAEKVERKKDGAERKRKRGGGVKREDIEEVKEILKRSVETSSQIAEILQKYQ